MEKWNLFVLKVSLFQVLCTGLARAGVRVLRGCSLKVITSPYIPILCTGGSLKKQIYQYFELEQKVCHLYLQNAQLMKYSDSLQTFVFHCLCLFCRFGSGDSRWGTHRITS